MNKSLDEYADNLDEALDIIKDLLIIAPPDDSITCTARKFVERLEKNEW